MVMKKDFIQDFISFQIVYEVRRLLYEFLATPAFIVAMVYTYRL
jgi:hypothetical protein